MGRFGFFGEEALELIVDDVVEFNFVQKLIQALQIGEWGMNEFLSFVESIFHGWGSMMVVAPLLVSSTMVVSSIDGDLFILPFDVFDSLLLKYFLILLFSIIHNKIFYRGWSPFCLPFHAWDGEWEMIEALSVVGPFEHAWALIIVEGVMLVRKVLNEDGLDSHGDVFLDERFVFLDVVHVVAHGLLVMLLGIDHRMMIGVVEGGVMNVWEHDCWDVDRSWGWFLGHLLWSFSGQTCSGVGVVLGHFWMIGYFPAVGELWPSGGVTSSTDGFQLEQVGAGTVSLARGVSKGWLHQEWAIAWHTL